MRLLRIALLLLACVPHGAAAHTMDVGTVTLNVADHRVYVALTLPLGMFARRDAASIASEVGRAVAISGGARAASLQGILVSEDGSGHAGHQIPAVLVLGVAVFDRQPARLRVTLDPAFIERTGKLKVVVTRGQGTQRASKEVRWITPERREAYFGDDASPDRFAPASRACP